MCSLSLDVDGYVERLFFFAFVGIAIYVYKVFIFQVSVSVVSKILILWENTPEE